MNFFKKFLSRHSFLVAPLIVFCLNILSTQNYIKSLFSKDVLQVHRKYEGQSILLLAIFEQDNLRKDVVNLLKVAKKLGLYTLVVNTRKLNKNETDINKELLDTYIEQHNFGRDFGSYKKGFNYIFKQKYHLSAKRILMMNDSVFFESSRLNQFIKELVNSKDEVLGATRNYEISVHLGSFCISLAKTITTNQNFIRFWRNFARSDVRPVVIEKGEMGLSKLLMRITKKNLKVIYDNNKIIQFFNKNPNSVEHFAKFVRTSNRVDWDSLSFHQIYFLYLKENNLFPNDLYDLKKDYPEQYLNFLKKFFSNNVLFERLSQIPLEFQKGFEEFLVATLLEQSKLGSQIHQNNLCFMYIGLPLVKLDLVYRGMMTDLDVLKFNQLMSLEEYYSLYELLSERNFGDRIYFGWRRIAFQRGLI